MNSLTAQSQDRADAPTITGVGLVTPLGSSAPSTWEALLDGQMIRDHARLVVDGADGARRIDAIAETAAREALVEAGWSQSHLTDPRTALVVGTSKGPVETWIEAPRSTSDKPLSGFGLADVSRALAERLRLGPGPRLTLSAACASGMHALIRAAMLIRDGTADRVLVVAAEASVHPLFLASFRRLGVLPPPGVGCRPYDRARAGFLMSDAAAAVCLEARPRTPGPRLTAYNIGADATHVTGTDASGTVLRRLLRTVLRPGRIDLIHGHGTGTEANDAVELAAIEACVSVGAAPSNARPKPPATSHNARYVKFDVGAVTGGLEPCSRPVLYSHKGAIGHSLGAAGLVAVVINVLCHRAGTIPAIANLRDPLPTTAVMLPWCLRHTPVRRSIAIAAGFGGAMAAVRLDSAAVPSLPVARVDTPPGSLASSRPHREARDDASEAATAQRET